MKEFSEVMHFKLKDEFLYMSTMKFMVLLLNFKDDLSLSCIIKVMYVKIYSLYIKSAL